MTGCMLVLSDYSCSPWLTSKAVSPVDESMVLFLYWCYLFTLVSLGLTSRAVPPMDGSEGSGDDPVTIPIDGR